MKNEQTHDFRIDLIDKVEAYYLQPANDLPPKKNKSSCVISSKALPMPMILFDSTQKHQFPKTKTRHINQPEFAKYRDSWKKEYERDYGESEE